MNALVPQLLVSTAATIGACDYIEIDPSYAILNLLFILRAT